MGIHSGTSEIRNPPLPIGSRMGADDHQRLVSSYAMGVEETVRSASTTVAEFTGEINYS